MPLIGRAREQEALRAAGAAWSCSRGSPGSGSRGCWRGSRASPRGPPCWRRARRSTRPTCRTPCGPRRWASALSGDDRHGTHRWLRSRLEELAAARPLVVCLDDVHWADPASREALLALIHRPPAGRVLLALATRTGQFPLERATVVRVGPLSSVEARELVGAGADAVYADSGGNPFYLEQLVRAAGEDAVAASGDGTVPPAVAAALAAELGGLGADARRLLDAAAVVGDPFDVDLAAEVAELGDGAAARGARRPPPPRPRPGGRRSTAVRVPAPGGAARGLRGGPGRVAARGARAGGGRARAAGGGGGRARAPRRAGRRRRRRGGDRAAERGRRGAAVARARDRRPLPRRRPAADARRRRRPHARCSCGSPTRRPRPATPPARATRCSTRCGRPRPRSGSR